MSKIDLLGGWVLHNAADQAPNRCTKEQDTRDALKSIGFADIEIINRNNMEAVLVAHQPVRRV
jgi:hypothetical protein